MLSEGMLLSVIGCGAGVMLARAAMIAVSRLPAGTIPRADSIAIHWTVVLVLAVIAIVVTGLSSLLPALLVARSNPQAALQSSSRGLGSHSVSGKLSGGLVAGEVALSTLLLVGTGLLFHTLWNLEQSRLGFEAAHVTTFSAMPADAAGFSAMAVSEVGGNAPSSVALLTYQPVLDRIRQVPGIESAALVTSPPLSGVDMNTSFEILGQAKDPANRPEARISAVSGDYARTMGTPVLRGRMIGDGDTGTTPYVAVINQTLARKYFAGKDPLQKQIDLGGKRTGMLTPYTVVGVLDDQIDGKVGGAVRPFILLSQHQVPTTSLFYQALLKTVVSFCGEDPRREARYSRRCARSSPRQLPGLALEDFETMEEAVQKNTLARKLGFCLVGSFAGLAVLMVVAGLYGVLSQLVSYRRREIGVRMALGATKGSVAQLMKRSGLDRHWCGAQGVGLLLAVVTGRWVKSFLYQVQPLDVLTYVAVVVALSTIGLIAALLPARKAASIEPMEALRED